MTLAINGGAPLIPEHLHKRYPPVGEREHARVAAALDGDALWGPWAPMLMELENRWSALARVRHTVALSSGTAALHCALIGCGIGPGDEVIVPAFSFIATAGSVLMAGAIPVFADVEESTGNVDASRVSAAITPRTRAIIAVHLHGLPADLDALHALAANNGLALIEDCAQAHAAEWNGMPVGGLGDAGAFSLNATKTLAGPEGGLLTTNSDAVCNTVAKARVFGCEWTAGERRIRDAESLGYNYRMHELTAAFTLARLDAFEEETALRIENARRLIAALRDLPGISITPELPGRRHVYQMLRVRLTPGALGIDMPPENFRERVVAALNAEGAKWWVWERKALPEYELFRERNRVGKHYPWSMFEWSRDLRYDPANYPVSVATSRDSIFTYGHYPQHDSSLIDLYASAFHKVWDEIHTLVEEVCRA